MINFKNIPSSKMETLIKKLDEKIQYVRLEFGFELKSYGNILRIGLNAVQTETIENLIDRLTINKELENELENAGGYTIDYLKDNNPKTDLQNLLDFIKENQPKQKALLNYLNRSNKRVIAVSDNNDLDFIRQKITNRKVKIIQYSDLKRMGTQNNSFVFHSFNGQRDFDYLYNLDNEIRLVVYKQERNLYHKYLDHRKKLIETELKSTDRLAIYGVEYKEARNNVTNISTTISGIVSRLDEMSGRAYYGYKNESDLLLDEIEEKLIYKIASDRATLFLDSNDTVFTIKGNLRKAYRIKIGDKVRIYPKEELAENLYQVAIETEPDIFGTVEEHAKFWKQIITNLQNKFGAEQLHLKLKEKGLKVLPNTLATYGKGLRKFPMFKNDLRAIFRLYYHEKSEADIDTILKPILESKTTYNSTMIALGRGLKQELRLFLKNKEIGEILQKRNFNGNTLQRFVDEFMPIHTITHREVSEDIESVEQLTLQLFEL